MLMGLLYKFQEDPMDRFLAFHPETNSQSGDKYMQIYHKTVPSIMCLLYKFREDSECDGQAES